MNAPITIPRSGRPHRQRTCRVYGPSIAQQLLAKLQKAEKDEDCWTIFFSACNTADGASSKTVRRWRRATEARIAELARARLALRPLIIPPVPMIVQAGGE